MRLGALADWPWLLWWLLSFVKLSTTQLQSYQKETLGELLLEPKTCIKEYGFWIYTNTVQCYLMQGTHTQEMSLPNPVALQSSRFVYFASAFFPCGCIEQWIVLRCLYGTGESTCKAVIGARATQLGAAALALVLVKSARTSVPGFALTSDDLSVSFAKCSRSSSSALAASNGCPLHS